MKVSGYPRWTEVNWIQCIFVCNEITRVIVPESLASIGGSISSRYLDLKWIDAQRTNFILVDEVLMNREMTEIIHCLPSKSGDYSIPNTVTIICVGAFNGFGKLTSITIPDSVTSIGAMTFSFCNAQNLSLFQIQFLSPGNLHFIEFNKSVVFSDTVISIGRI